MKAKTQFTNLYNLRDYFKNEEICREYLEKFRWEDKPVCPFCNSDKVYRLKDNKTFKCAKKECYKKFTVTVGTIFENTKIPLSKWFIAMYLITSHTKGISSVQLGKDVGITQKTAWFVNHRIREMLKEKNPGLLANMVEVDETYVGGTDYNRHKNNKKSTGSGLCHKMPVFGLLERDKKVIAFKVHKTDGATLKPLIMNLVDKSAMVVSDGYGAYHNLKKEYSHIIVDHARGIYKSGIYHTNTLEGFWSIFKRGITGIYHSVSEKHLDRYVTEFSQRYNTRSETEAERFNNFLTKCNGRLKYNDLIK